jgi:cytochrome c biogenesis protein CcmG/thiol:disulfide interchange protein DsbE
LKRNIVIFSLVLAVVAVMLLSNKLAKKPAGDQIDQASFKGKPAPEFQLKDLNGKTVKLSDYRGKAVLLNFWATWCPPCKAEMPWFVDMQNRYAAQGFQVVGISMDEGSPGDVAKFSKEIGVNYPVLLGDEHVSDQYGSVQALPTSFFIDRNGNIVNRVFGLAERKDIENNVIKLLASPAPANTVPNHSGME